MTVLPRTAVHCARLSLLTLGLASSVLLPQAARAAFGVTSSGGYYVVDNGANLVFKIKQSNADLTSIKYKGEEVQDPSQPGHVESGFGSSVAATVIGDYIKITINGTLGGDSAIHYYVAKKGVDTIYMASYAGVDIGEMSWHTVISKPSTTFDPGIVARTPSDDATLIEGGDTFVEPDGTTRSKFLATQMAKDLSVLGRSGTGFGVYMAFGNRESGGGGPFFKDNQSGTGGVWNVMYSQHHQIDAPKNNVLYGPYAMIFTDGTARPGVPDMSFFSSLGITGYVPASGRGRVALTGINGRDPDYTYTVGFKNDTAQYWTTAYVSSGGASCPNMKPGTYDMTIYKNQLEVYQTSGITVTAGGVTALSTRTITDDPSTIPVLWRIGDWDGTPLGFKYGNSSQIDGIPYITYMHPSDVRMDWSPVTFTVGSSTSNVFPAYQWQDVNNPTTIKFNLTAAQVAARTVRIGITDAFSSGRPKITVNGWSSSLPGSSVQPGGRSLTIGTYRGNNTTFTYNVPASAFVVGQNTMTINIISGAGASNYLSGSVAYDCVEMD